MLSGGATSENTSLQGVDLSPEELKTLVDEAHRQGLKVAAHAHSAGSVIAAVLPHGRNAEEFEHLVNLGMHPLDALRSATINAAELLDLPDRG